jgi:hypothetical protein
MRRLLPPALVIVLGIVVAVAIRERFRSRPATPSPLPAGDYEVAWIHTSTSPQTWERLVAAMYQIRREYPGVIVDDSQAFPEQTATIPEVVLSAPGRTDKLRIRWYKLSGEVGNREWVSALAARKFAPIAFMGGASSDRAIELAQALDDQKTWHGSRPLLFITTATANVVVDPDTHANESLLRLYQDRSFRGCFTNEAMARAVVDFVWQSPDLKPGPLPGAPAGAGIPEARAYVLAWQDDPYSVDLAEQFAARFREREVQETHLLTVLDNIKYSVSTFTDLNPPERKVLEENILPDLASHPKDRSLLVLPAATQPARRLLRALASDSPLIGQRLVAITGDGVSFNTLYRDSDVAWPIRELAIPLVFFAHQNPVAWTPGEGPPDTMSMHPPNSTDDVLLFSDIIRVIAQAIFLGDHVFDADGLAVKLRAGQPPYYAPDGERRAGEGEYVIVLRPQFENGRVARDAIYEIFTRRAGRWDLVRKLVGSPSNDGSKKREGFQ